MFFNIESVKVDAVEGTIFAFGFSKKYNFHSFRSEVGY